MALAVFKFPNKKVPHGKESLIIALDRINDPGNLGTIIRTCDWFGVSQIICSKDSVDCYNPKVIQSSMGSVARVQIGYIPIEEYIEHSKLKVFATSLKGEPISQLKPPKKGIILFGNEANGVSESLLKKANKEITIPRYTTQTDKPDSLNVATSVGIVLAKFSLVSATNRREKHFL
ncbi:RNA methyltransferase [Elysia marginata]|uniref:RNA methyltransferase n=1 Tax=Elysia marginata TaxID=1093978 RepID=A0AAV4FRI5_9GAST|nr:RNA methyltransferase [Elysia marginata]